MDYPQSSGLPALMANYGNISQGMNPGQQPSLGGGNPYFPSMPMQQQYQPQQNWGGFAPGQLNAQYGTPNTYGTQDGMVNYGYGLTNLHPQYTPVAQPLDMSHSIQAQNDIAAQDAQKALQAQIDYHAANHR